MAEDEAPQFPDGVDARNADEARIPSLVARFAPVVVLAAILALALSGFLGGTPNPRYTASGDGGRLEIDAPRILRNGEFFEIRFHLVPSAPIADATLVIEEPYLRDITVNSFMPAAEKEESKQGAFHFSYGPLEPGEAIEVKLDGQINPPLFAGTAGKVSFADGTRTIASIPLKLRVLP